MGFPGETIQRGEMDLKRTLDDGQPLAKGKLDRRRGQRGWAPQKTQTKKKGPPVFADLAIQGKRKLNPSRPTNTASIVTDGLKGK